MIDRTAADVLSKTAETLATAKQGLADLVGPDPNRRLTGLRNVAVFGRSVTFVLQTMRSVDRKKFDAWYTPVQQEMVNDPLLKYFGDLRTEILKEGTPNHGAGVFIEFMGPVEMAAMTANPPPGAKAFFLGDNLGGNGWEIELADGTVEKYYVQLPDWIRVQNTLHMPNPPAEHLGQTLIDTSLENLSALFVAYLEKLVADAEAHFA